MYMITSYVANRTKQINMNSRCTRRVFFVKWIFIPSNIFESSNSRGLNLEIKRDKKARMMGSKGVARGDFI